jgi:hypothetical protein
MQRRNWHRPPDDGRDRPGQGDGAGFFINERESVA